MLHIVTTPSAFKECIHFLSSLPRVELTHHEVVILDATFSFSDLSLPFLKIYVLANHPLKDINVIHYEEFLNLVIKHDKTLTWQKNNNENS